MSELLPCPFCGGEAEILTFWDFYRCSCKNTECTAHVADPPYVQHAEGTWYGSINEAREAWNTRSVETCAITDEIELEIAEKYMLLPVDTDGVPIHVGDLVQFVNEQGGTGAPVEVCAISKHYAYYGEGKNLYRADWCRHVKPRTIEDVLLEAIERAACPENEWSEIIADCADDLRQMGVDNG